MTDFIIYKGRAWVSAEGGFTGKLLIDLDKKLDQMRTSINTIDDGTLMKIQFLEMRVEELEDRLGERGGNEIP